MFELFEGEKVVEEIEATKKAEKAAMTQADLEAAMQLAEDESDRAATLRVNKEAQEELIELDESQPFPADTRAAMSSTSEAESAPEEDPRLNLDAQLSKLKGVEKHALHVLER